LVQADSTDQDHGRKRDHNDNEDNVPGQRPVVPTVSVMIFFHMGCNSNLLVLIQDEPGRADLDPEMLRTIYNLPGLVCQGEFAPKTPGKDGKLVSGKAPLGQDTKAFRAVFPYALPVLSRSAVSSGPNGSGSNDSRPRGSAEGSRLSGCGKGPAGIGFAKDVQHHVFEAVYVGALFFYQSDIAQDRWMVEVF
jgi:hypothetical protein